MLKNNPAYKIFAWLSIREISLGALIGGIGKNLQKQNPIIDISPAHNVETVGVTISLSN